MPSFTAACKNFFGFRSGDDLKEFAMELRALPYEDKQDIHEGLLANGVECEPPTQPSTQPSK